MKKIITTITAVIAILVLSGLAHSRGANEEYTVNMEPLAGKMGFYYSDGDTLVSGFDFEQGYVATFWFGGLEGEGNWTLVGASVFADRLAVEVWGYEQVEEIEKLQGLLKWQSAPDNIGDIVKGETYEFCIRIFHSSELAGKFLPEYNYGDDIGTLDNNWSRIDVDPDSINKAWNLALSDWNNGGDYEIGEFFYTMKADSGYIPEVWDSNTSINGFPNIKAGEMGSVKDGKLILEASRIPDTNPVPEPSTWLLLGAGAAFVLIFRRRKSPSN